MESDYLRTTYNRERSELLHSGEAALRSRGQNHQAEQKALDAMLDESRSLDNSSNLVASMIAQGSASLER